MSDPTPPPLTEEELAALTDAVARAVHKYPTHGMTLELPHTVLASLLAEVVRGRAEREHVAALLTAARRVREDVLEDRISSDGWNDSVDALRDALRAYGDDR